jgi:hypothetical protein
VEKRTKILLLALLVLLIVLAGIWLGRSGASGTLQGKTVSPLEQSLTQRIQALEAVDFSLKVLELPGFQNFEQSGEVPVQAESSGRDNPFAPF